MLKYVVYVLHTKSFSLCVYVLSLITSFIIKLSVRPQHFVGISVELWKEIYKTGPRWPARKEELKKKTWLNTHTLTAWPVLSIWMSYDTHNRLILLSRQRKSKEWQKQRAVIKEEK